MCLSVDEWRSRFPRCEESEGRQFAHELVLHLTRLHEAGTLTADFLQVAFTALSKAVELDSLFRKTVINAMKCLETHVVQQASLPRAALVGALA